MNLPERWRMTPRVIAKTVFAFIAFINVQAHADVLSTVNNWYASRNSTATFNWLKGEDNCAWGDDDCNVCAPNVVDQFRQAFEKEEYEGGMAWSDYGDHFWEFSDTTNYFPSTFRVPKSFYGSPGEHIQGFVRTNSDKYPYAGSHSDNQQPSVFVVEKTPWMGGELHLTAMHDPDWWHPSGVHILGKYLFSAEQYEDSDEYYTSIRTTDIENPRYFQDMEYDLPSSEILKGAGGGLGVAKLRGGGYLILVTTPGSLDQYLDRHNYFYFVDGDPRDPTRMELLGDWIWEEPASWNKNYHYGYSENMTLITECGTGDIYAVHTNGVRQDDDPNGFWRLTRVDWDSSGPHLVPIDYWWQSQDVRYCHHRSAATAHVNRYGAIDLYCHERDVDHNSHFDFLKR